eukprot:gene5840-61207_t
MPALRGAGREGARAGARATKEPAAQALLGLCAAPSPLTAVCIAPPRRLPARGPQSAALCAPAAAAGSRAGDPLGDIGVDVGVDRARRR